MVYNFRGQWQDSNEKTDGKGLCGCNSVGLKGLRWFGVHCGERDEIQMKHGLYLQERTGVNKVWLLR